MSTVEGVQAAIVAIKRKIPFILAAILLISGVFEAVNFLVFGGESASIGDLCAAVVKILIGLFIIFDPKRSLLRSVGFYAISLGLSRVIDSVILLGEPSDVMFIAAIVMIALGVNLFVSGYNYLHDTSRGRFGMTMGSAALDLMMILMIVITFTSGDGSDEEFRNMIVYSISVVQYTLILIIMDSDEFRFSSLREKSVKKLDEVRLTYTLTPGMHVSRDDALVLKHMFDDRSSWSAVEDGGPVECERKLWIFEEKVASVMILQKWKGSDRIYVTMAADDKGTILQANRFWITDVVADDPDDGTFMNVRLYADGAMLSNISVEKEAVE
jgi:hypothetical protein